jgi:hypothetical protein
VDLLSWLRLVIALSGACVAAHGVWILITAAPRAAINARSDGGLYYLCFGLALALLALGQLWNGLQQTLPAAAVFIVTAVLIGLGLRYRPRRDKRL